MSLNLSSVVMTIKTRIVLLAIAALAVVGIGALIADGAGAASSGGVGTASGSDGGSSGGDAGASNRTGLKYERIWNNKVSQRDRRWAHRTAQCESSRNPDAIGGGGLYRGAFQFMRSTWKSSPKSPGGDPIRYSYRTQAVVAILLKRRDGAGHWPVCG